MSNRSNEFSSVGIASNRLELDVRGLLAVHRESGLPLRELIAQRLVDKASSLRDRGLADRSEGYKKLGEDILQASRLLGYLIRRYPTKEERIIEIKKLSERNTDKYRYVVDLASEINIDPSGFSLVDKLEHRKVNLPTASSLWAFDDAIRDYKDIYTKLIKVGATPDS